MIWTNLSFLLIVLRKQYKKARKVIVSLQGMIRKPMIARKLKRSSGQQDLEEYLNVCKSGWWIERLVIKQHCF
jgi:hypothetical protein